MGIAEKSIIEGWENRRLGSTDSARLPNREYRSESLEVSCNLRGRCAGRQRSKPHSSTTSSLPRSAATRSPHSQVLPLANCPVNFVVNRDFDCEFFEIGDLARVEATYMITLLSDAKRKAEEERGAFQKKAGEGRRLQANSRLNRLPHQPPKITLQAENFEWEMQFYVSAINDTVDFVVEPSVRYGLMDHDFKQLLMVVDSAPIVDD
ncbi:unnamed protein product [Linum trigynum]|uniref:Uncharacterized protein n=1 Tax=Linum trigynum TaxID=586398 RepID=A0AAV2C9C7_9ROSI